jgi:hypothetical protein
VVFDELPLASLMTRSGEIDRNLFPHFARLQRDSIWYRNATTMATLSHQAIPALVSGVHPEDWPAKYRPPSSNIFTLLSDSHEVHARGGSAPDVCRPGRCAARGDPRLVATLPPSFGRFRDSDRARQFASFLKDLRPAKKPGLHFVHVVLPHSPWTYLPSGQRYPQTEPMPGETDPPGMGRGWAADSWLVEQGYQRHLLQARLVDRLLGALLSRLKTTDMYDETLLVVVADHGLGFEPGLPKRLVTPRTVGHLAPIPLFFKRPFQRRALVSDFPVQLTDIVGMITHTLARLGRRGRHGRASEAPEGVIHPSGPRRIQDIEIGVSGSQKYDLVRWKYRTFGGGDKTIDLFLVGPGRSERLIGRAVDEMKVARFGGATAQVANLRLIENASPGSDPFPALMEGTLNGVDEASPVHVAAAIDGRIAGVTRTHTEAGRLRLYYMLSPRFFGPAPNDLDLFIVQDAEAGRLIPLPLGDGAR